MTPVAVDVVSSVPLLDRDKQDAHIQGDTGSLMALPTCDAIDVGQRGTEYGTA